MDAPAFVKAILINAAYQGASAVCGPLQTDDGESLPIDPLLQDAGLQKKGLLVYEQAKVQYNALLRAFHDKTGIWPDPKVAADSGAGWTGIVSQAIGLLGQLPRDTPIGTIGQILDLISIPRGTAQQPGQELKS